MIPRTARERGFTLVELAIVTGIISLLLGGLVVVLSAQLDAQRLSETRETLNRINDALLGFAAANGRLPCPATASSNGAEAPAGGGDCSSAPGAVASGNSVHGFLPAATLGLSPTNIQGYLIDGWGNRIRYALFRGPINVPTGGTLSDVFTTSNRMRTVTMANAATTNLLNLCSGASTGGTSCTGGAVTLTDRAPAVFYSEGRNGGTAAGNDEAENLTKIDTVFASHEPTGAGSGGAYDDLVRWLSLNILFNRMITAGRLP